LEPYAGNYSAVDDQMFVNSSYLSAQLSCHREIMGGEKEAYAIPSGWVE